MNAASGTTQHVSLFVTRAIARGDVDSVYSNQYAMRPAVIMAGRQIASAFCEGALQQCLTFDRRALFSMGKDKRCPENHDVRTFL
jgi:hypothetical protein